MTKRPEPRPIPEPDAVREYAHLAKRPDPTPAQVKAFRDWHLKRTGEELPDEEASERLSHAAHLIFLSGGAEWLAARKREREERKAEGRTRRGGGRNRQAS